MTSSRAFPILADEAQLQAARASYRTIGAILIDAGRITPAHADKICRLQADSGERFGAIACKLGLVSQEDLDDALDLQFNTARLRASNSTVSPDVRAAFEPACAELQEVRELATILATRAAHAQGCAKAVSVVAANRFHGRSLLVANLGVVLAQMDCRVLMVDANFPAPRLHALFGVDNRSGLSNVLCGLSAGSALKAIPGLGPLTLLPSGVCPPGAYDLTLRDAFKQFLTEVAGNFDVVLVDPSAGAQPLIAATTSALLVVRTHVTTVDELAAFHRHLKRLESEVFGYVFSSR